MIRALLAAAALLASPAAAAGAPPSLPEALASQVGSWEGKLEYRDYSANKWFGLPVKVTISDGGDGVTLIRVADYDDGPKAGTVRITTVSTLGKDGTSEYSASFRKGQKPEVDTAALTLTSASDASHWTIVSRESGTDDDRPATIRVTLVRDGDNLTSLKEVDFSDDDREEWLVRNRTTLRRTPTASNQAF